MRAYTRAQHKKGSFQTTCGTKAPLPPCFSRNIPDETVKAHAFAW